MNIIDKIIAETEEDLGLSKIANDANGAPESPANTANGQQDILSVANSFLQEVEQFKAQVGGAAIGGEPQNEEEVAAMAAQQQQGGEVMPPTENAGSATIQTPGGSVIKIAGLIKLAALRGSDLFKEVE